MRATGTNGRGPIILTGRAHPLVHRLVEAINAERKSLNEVAESAGFDKTTVRSWDKHVPRLDHFDAALNAVGLELFVRPRRSPVEGGAS